MFFCFVCLFVGVFCKLGVMLGMLEGLFSGPWKAVGNVIKLVLTSLRFMPVVLIVTGVSTYHS